MVPLQSVDFESKVDRAGLERIIDVTSLAFDIKEYSRASSIVPSQVRTVGQKAPQKTPLGANLPLYDHSLGFLAVVRYLGTGIGMLIKVR